MVGAAAGVPRRTLSNGHDSRTEDWEAMSQCARFLKTGLNVRKREVSLV